MIAYVSPFVPPEWIATHGLKPHRLELDGSGGRAGLVPRRGVCPFAGKVVDTVLAHSLPDAASGATIEALVLTTACDQMRSAAALLELDGALPVFLMNVPSTWQTETARRLYRDEIERLGRFLMQRGGTTPSNDHLYRTAIEYEEARNLAADEAQARAGREEGTALALVGGPVPGKTELLQMIARAGGRIVLDASEDGERWLPAPLDRDALRRDPVGALAAAYFDGLADPFRRPNTQFYEWLGRRLAARAVRGILFRRYVWCDLWHAELHRLRAWSRLPVLDFDVDDDRSAQARSGGRIEAFLETLR